jgi:hypothetical protein
MRLRMGYLWGLLGACGAACGEEFPNEPTGTLTVQVQPGLKDTMTVRDTANLVIQIGDSRGESITGIEVDWQSSDAAVLELQPLPPSTQAPEGSLASQLTIRSIAHARGQAVVVATIDRPGFERTELKDTITILERWLSVSAGASHTCAIASDSAAYCWGSGDEGRLGRGRPLDGFVPARVIGPGSFKFTTISAGEENTCGVIAEGVAYCWGAGTHGSLGNGNPSEESAFIPVQVSGPTFRSLDVGIASCGVGDDSAALCWGTNGSRQLGFNMSLVPGLDICIDASRCSLFPRAVWVDETSLATTPVTYQQISVGDSHSCGISLSPQSGLAFCWGTGLQGALGNESATFAETPIPVTGGLHFRSLTAGGDHTCGITTSDITYCWGANSEGQLGNGTTSISLTPTAVSGATFTMVSAGHQHVCAGTAQGEAFCWGLGSAGQLGNGTTGRQTRPVAVTGLFNFESISAGAFHTCGLVRGGALYCWGRGSSGRLGNGTIDDRSTPTRVSEPE